MFSLHLKLPNLSVFGATGREEGGGGGGVVLFNHFAWPPSYFSLATGLPRTGKALVDDCGLMLQTPWRENAPKKNSISGCRPWLQNICA